MIIERYLYREVATTFLGVFGVLLLIFVSHRFVQYLAGAAAGELSSDLLVELLVVKVVANLVLILPLAFFVALLLAMGRLYADSEVTAMSAGGIGLGRLLLAVTGLSVLFALFALGLSLYATPAAHGLGDEIENRAEEASEITGIAGGRFKEFGGGERVFYAEEISSDRTRLSHVFVHMRDRERPFMVIAESGYQMTDPATGDRFMVMVDGHSYEGRPGEADLVVTRFREYGIRIEDNPVVATSRPINQVPTGALLAMEGAAAAAEFQWRISLPLSMVLLGPLGLLLARTSPRQGRFGRLFYGVLIYFIYTNLLGVSRELVARGDLAPELGVWLVHLGVAGVVGAMYVVQSGGAWRAAAALRRRVP